MSNFPPLPPLPKKVVAQQTEVIQEHIVPTPPLPKITPPLPGAVQTKIDFDISNNVSQEIKIQKLPEGGKIPTLAAPEVISKVPPFMSLVEEKMKAVEQEPQIEKVVPLSTFNGLPPLPPKSSAPPVNNLFTAKTASNPFGNSSSLYEISLPENASKRFMEIYKSGKNVEELTQEERREAYYSITGKMGTPIFTATTINHINKTGNHPDYDDREESDWLFIGSAIHEAAETQGESLKKLFYFDGSTIPEMPEEYKKLSKDHRDIAEHMIRGNKSDLEAYMLVKDTVAVKKVDPKWIAEGYIFESDKEVSRLTERVASLQAEYTKLWQQLESDPIAYSFNDKQMKTIGKSIDQAEKEMGKVKDSDDKKCVLAVAKSASTEYEKIKEYFSDIKKYFEDLDKYDAKKDIVRNNASKVDGAIIIDDLPYIKQRGFRVYETIAKTYGAFSNSKDAFNIYHPQNVSQNKFECFSEYVILYSHKLPNGKTVPMRSMIDRICVDHTSKVIWVIDLKTHGRTDFLGENYVGHAYWRSMSVYYHAMKSEAEKLGWGDYQIICSILPISMVSLEVGVYGVPLLNLSKEEIELGTNGGYVKPEWFDFFDANKQLSYALSNEAAEHMIKIGAMSTDSPKYKRRGWKKIIEDFVAHSLPGGGRK